MNTPGAEKLEQISDTLQSYYYQYFMNMNDLEGIDHVPDEIIDMMSPGSLLLVQERQLGLSFTGISILFEECNKLLKNIKSDDINEDQIQISDMISKILLCINGEHPKCCHIRQFLLYNKRIDLEEERHFNEIICKKFKKSSIIWHYRHKIIDQILQQQQKVDINQLLIQENTFLKSFFNKFPRNYHGWSYKISLLKRLIEKGYKIDFESEFEWIKTYCENNIHEFSAFNYLFLLLRSTNFSTKEDILFWAQHLKIRYEEFYIDSDSLSEINYGQLLSLNKFITLLCGQDSQLTTSKQ